MAKRSGARRSASAGAVGDGVLPALASSATARKRSRSAASEAAPISNAPRSGILHWAGLEFGALLSLFVVAMEVGMMALTFAGRSITDTDRLPFPFRRCGIY